MKGFDEWNGSGLCDFDSESGKFSCETDCKTLTCGECKRIRQTAWRAALKWTLKNANDCGDWWAEEINKELES